jgi:hypothetical protein
VRHLDKEVSHGTMAAATSRKRRGMNLRRRPMASGEVAALGEADPGAGDDLEGALDQYT